MWDVVGLGSAASLHPIPSFPVHPRGALLHEAAHFPEGNCPVPELTHPGCCEPGQTCTLGWSTVPYVLPLLGHLFPGNLSLRYRKFLS